MNAVDPAAISALERADLKRYPNEIDGVANRGTPANPAQGKEYPRVAEEIEIRGNDAQAPAPSEKPFSLWEEESFGFRDLLDIINPLHHIPIVATLYRNMSGDKIGMAPRVIGGAVWGRIGGFVSGLLNAVVSWFTGKDIGDHIYAAIFGAPGEHDAGIAVARAAEPLTADSEAPSSESQETQIVSPTGVSATEEPLIVPAAAEPAASVEPKFIAPLSFNSQLPSAAAIQRRSLYPYLQARERDERDEDAPRVRVTV